MAYYQTFGISVAKLKEKIKSDPFGIYVFFGAEEMLKEFYAEKLKKVVTDGVPDGMNAVRIDLAADENGWETMEGETYALPMMSDRKIIVCRGMIPGKTEEETKRLLALAENFPEGVILVFLVRGEEFSADKKTLAKKSVQRLAEALTFVSFPLQEERVLLTWAKKILASDGLEADDRALKKLFALSSGKMIYIRPELEKAALYCKANGLLTVTEDVVDKFSRDTKEFQAYNLCDAVLAGAMLPVQRILHSLREQNAEPIVLTAAIARLIGACLLIMDGAGEAEAQKAGGVLPWQYQKYAEAVFRRKKENFVKALELCREVDRRLKGYRSDAFVIFSQFVCEVTLLLGEKS